VSIRFGGGGEIVAMHIYDKTALLRLIYLNGCAARKIGMLCNDKSEVILGKVCCGGPKRDVSGCDVRHVLPHIIFLRNCAADYVQADYYQD
jgi:hypothetical protein